MARYEEEGVAVSRSKRGVLDETFGGVAASGATHKAPGYEFFIDPESGDSYRLDLASGNTTWMHPHQHHGQTEVITHRETRFSMELKETEKMRSRTKVFEREVKSSWFFVLSDCALEFYPAKPPALHFDLDLRSDSKHLPEDLRGLGVIYGIALLGMAGTFAAFVVEGYRRYQTSKSCTRSCSSSSSRTRVSWGRSCSSTCISRCFR